MGFVKLRKRPETIQEKKEAAKATLQILASQKYMQMVQSIEQMHDFFWKNIDLTPIEIAEALGTDAADALSIVDNILETLKKIVPETPDLVVPFNVIKNPDGTVTLQEKK